MNQLMDFTNIGLDTQNIKERIFCETTKNALWTVKAYVWMYDPTCVAGGEMLKEKEQCCCKQQFDREQGQIYL